jgi:hypothetical protein
MKSITVPNFSKTTPPEPMLEHAIRLRAYEFYAQRGKAEGHGNPRLARGGRRAAVWPIYDCSKLEPGIKALKVN